LSLYTHILLYTLIFLLYTRIFYCIHSYFTVYTHIFIYTRIFVYNKTFPTDVSGCCNSTGKLCHPQVLAKDSNATCTITGTPIHKECYVQLGDEENGVCFSCLRKGICSCCDIENLIIRPCAKNLHLVCNDCVELHTQTPQDFDCPKCVSTGAVSSSSSYVETFKQKPQKARPTTQSTNKLPPVEEKKTTRSRGNKK